MGEITATIQTGHMKKTKHAEGLARRSYRLARRRQCVAAYARRICYAAGCMMTTQYAVVYTRS